MPFQTICWWNNQVIQYIQAVSYPHNHIMLLSSCNLKSKRGTLFEWKSWNYQCKWKLHTYELITALSLIDFHSQNKTNMCKTNSTFLTNRWRYLHQLSFCSQLNGQIGQWNEFVLFPVWTRNKSIDSDLDCWEPESPVWESGRQDFLFLKLTLSLCLRQIELAWGSGKPNHHEITTQNSKGRSSSGHEEVIRYAACVCVNGSNNRCIK